MVAKRRVSRTNTLAAPTGGIDDTNPMAAMDPHYCIELINMFPQNQSLRVRPGYRYWTTGLPAIAQTLIPYERDTGSRFLFACTSSGMYDITTTGAAGAPVRALTNGYCDYVIFSNAAAQWLVVVNQSATSFVYNGATYFPIVHNAAPANPGEFNVAGLASTNGFSQVCSHKRRLWFVQAGSMDAYYGPVDAVGGTATRFQLGSIFKRGGYLINMFTWTRGAGDGIDDILVFVSSNGELAGYAGTDPSTAATWALEAIFYMGPPKTRRSFADLGSDIAILNVYGVQSMTKIVSGIVTAGSTEEALSKRISRTLNEFAQNNQLPAWELTSIQSLQYLVLNTQATSVRPAKQYVMNMLNGAWTTYDLPMYTCTEYNGFMFFSDNANNVYIFGNSNFVDGTTIAGAIGQPILSGFMQAYADFGDLSTDKSFKLVRPIFSSDVKPAYTVRVNADYGPQNLNSLQTPGPITSTFQSVWDRSLWDQANWSEGVTSWYEWCGVSAVGYSGALLIKMRTSSDTEYMACNWAYEPGIAL